MSSINQAHSLRSGDPSCHFQPFLLPWPRCLWPRLLPQPCRVIPHHVTSGHITSLPATSPLASLPDSLPPSDLRGSCWLPSRGSGWGSFPVFCSWVGLGAWMFHRMQVSSLPAVGLWVTTPERALSSPDPPGGPEPWPPGLHCRVWGGLMHELDYKGASRNPCFKCIGAEMGRGDHLVCSEFGRDHSQWENISTSEMKHSTDWFYTWQLWWLEKASHNEWVCAAFEGRTGPCWWKWKIRVTQAISSSGGGVVLTSHGWLAWLKCHGRRR